MESGFSVNLINVCTSLHQAKDKKVEATAETGKVYSCSALSLHSFSVNKMRYLCLLMQKHTNMFTANKYVVGNHSNAMLDSRVLPPP